MRQSLANTPDQESDQRTSTHQDALYLRPILMTTQSREVRLASRPSGVPPSTISLSPPSTSLTQIRERFWSATSLISVDPYMRGRMNEGQILCPAIPDRPAARRWRGRTVIASQDEKFPVGAYVQSIYGWREAFVAPASRAPNCRHHPGPAIHLPWHPRHHRLHRLGRVVSHRDLKKARQSLSPAAQARLEPPSARWPKFTAAK